MVQCSSVIASLELSGHVLISGNIVVMYMIVLIILAALLEGGRLRGSSEVAFCAGNIYSSCTDCDGSYGSRRRWKSVWVQCR